MKKSKKKKTIGDLIWRVVFLVALACFLLLCLSADHHLSGIQEGHR